VTEQLIDSHIHFWDLTHPDISYDWLAPKVLHPVLGDVEAIKSSRYDVDAFIAESRFTGVTAAVHVQAAVGTADPVEETRWLTEMAAHSPIPFVIVAGVDLSADDVEAQLDAHAVSPLLRGARDYGRAGYLEDPAFHRGVQVLAAHDLVLDLDTVWQDMPRARDLADEVPGMPVVVDHIGFPRDTTSPEYFESWRTGISAIAAAPNVYCKISGLGMNRAGWTVEGLRPWVEHCLEQFGAERCMFGSNWPVDRLWGSYDAYVAAFRELISGYSPAERELLSVGVAERVFRVSDTAS
jgi:predicted TIM-barrel fold metal-dependent hydrolase